MYWPCLEDDVILIQLYLSRVFPFYHMFTSQLLVLPFAFDFELHRVSKDHELMINVYYNIAR